MIFDDLLKLFDTFSDLLVKLLDLLRMHGDVLDLHVDKFDESLHSIVLLDGHAHDTLKALLVPPVTIDLSEDLHEQLLYADVDTVKYFVVTSGLLFCIVDLLWIGLLATEI